MKRTLLLCLTALILFFVIYPSAFLYPSTTLPDDNDTRLISYILGQVQQNITNLKPLYFGTFFAPDQNTLSYSDLFATTAILTLPLRFFTSSPIIIFNLALILGFTLTFITSYYLFDYLFKDSWITLLSTLIFTLSGFHFSYLPHLQIFNLWVLCLSILFFLRYQNENKPKYLNFFYITITFQLIESVFPVYLIFFTTLILFFQKPRQVKTIILRMLPFIPLWVIISFPYLHLHSTFPEATRSIRDAAHFSLGIEEVFTKFHSWTVIILLLLSTKLTTKIKSWWFIFGFSLTMTLGPVLKFLGQTVKVFGFPIPLPYTLFYYLFPGFTGFRTPSRFIIVTLLAAVIIIGYKTMPFFNKLKKKTKITVSLLILGFLLLELKLPINSYFVDITPPLIYQLIKTLPSESVIIELPLKLWNDENHEIESLRSLYSLQHNHRRFGGFSGFATNKWIELVQRINLQGLSNENMLILRSLGITHVVNANELYALP